MNKVELYNKFRSSLLLMLERQLTSGPEAPLKAFEGKSLEILKCTARTVIEKSARQTGKSLRSAFIIHSLILFGIIYNEPINVIIGAPITEDAEHIWDYLIKFLKYTKFQENFGLKSNTQYYTNYGNNATSKKYELTIRANKRILVETASCNDPKGTGIRGGNYDLTILEEFQNIRNKESILGAFIPAMGGKNNLNLLRIIGTSEIQYDPAEIWKKLAELEKTTNHVKSFNLTTADNPHLNHEVLNEQKSLLDQNTIKREFDGIDVPPTGLYFPAFNEVENIRNINYNPSLPLIIGVDPAGAPTKPHIAEFTQIVGNYPDMNVYVIDEIAHQGTIEDFIQLIQEKVESWGAEIQVLGIDKATSDKLTRINTYTDIQLFERFFPTKRMFNSQLVSKRNQGIMLNRLIEKNKLIVNETCTKLINGLYTAAPDVNMVTGAVNSGGWKKIKGIDDPIDALCYALINYEPTSLLIMNNNVKVVDYVQEQILNHLASWAAS